MFRKRTNCRHATSSDLPDLGARTRDNHVEINDEMIAADRRYIAAPTVEEHLNVYGDVVAVTELDRAKCTTPGCIGPRVAPR